MPYILRPFANYRGRAILFVETAGIRFFLRSKSGMAFFKNTPILFVRHHKEGDQKVKLT